MPRKKFKALRDQMSPESRGRSQAKARQMLAEMLLSELRKAVGITQSELARVLGITQASVSKLENQSDMQVSTLRRMVEALGGTLEIRANFAQGSVALSQFNESIEPQHLRTA